MTDYRTRLARALAEGEAAGISRTASFPPFLRAVSTMCLPVRPLHFMSVPGLVIFLALRLGLILALFHWIASNIGVDAWAVRKLRDLGLAGAIVLGVVGGVLTAIVIRFQALRADLPAWRDL